MRSEVGLLRKEIIIIKMLDDMLLVHSIYMGYVVKSIIDVFDKNQQRCMKIYMCTRTGTS